MSIDIFREDLNRRMNEHYLAIKGESVIKPSAYAYQLIEAAAFLQSALAEEGICSTNSELCMEQITHIAAEMLRYSEIFDGITNTEKPVSH